MSNTIKITTTDPGKPSITDESDITRPRRTYISKPNERSPFFYYAAWIIFICTLINFGLFLKDTVEDTSTLDAIVPQVIFSVALWILCIYTIKKDGNVNLLFKIILLLIFLMIVLFIFHIAIVFLYLKIIFLL